MVMIKGTSGQTQDEIKNGQFLQGSQNWILGANWAIDGTGVLHTAGAVESVLQTMVNATLTTVTYDITVYIEGISAGTLTVHEGSGATGTVLSTNGWHDWTSVLTTDKVLSFTPSTDFDGKISVVRVRAVK